MIAKMAAFSVLFFVSFFWIPLFYIMLVGFVIVIALEFSYKSLAYILYFGVWVNYSLTTIIYAVITGLYIGICFIKILFIEPKSELKKMIVFTLAFIPFLIYICIPPFAGNSASLLSYGLLLFVCIYAAEKIGFKSMVLWFSYGLIVSSFIGLFVYQITFLNNAVASHYIAGIRRFSGITVNPNIFYRHILCAVAGISILSLKKQIKWWEFFALLVVLSSFGFMTLSRGFYMFYPIILFMYIVLLIIRDKQRSFIQISILCLAMIIAVVSMYKYTLPAIAWVFETFNIETNIETGSDTEVNDELINSSEPLISQFDPGRWNIWRDNIKEWTTDPVTFIFGNGLDSPNTGGVSQHNAIVFVAVKMGLVGLLAFVGFLVAVFWTMYGAKRCRFRMVQMLLILGLVSVCIVEKSFPTMRFFQFLILFVICVGDDKKAEISTKSDFS